MKVQQEQHEQNRGSGMVISNSREFDDRLMLKILQPKASDCEYRAYLASLYGLSNQIKERFPLLTLTLLPASEKVLAYIKGDLIPRKELQDYGKTAAIKNPVRKSGCRTICSRPPVWSLQRTARSAWRCRRSPSRSSRRTTRITCPPQSRISASRTASSPWARSRSS